MSPLHTKRLTRAGALVLALAVLVSVAALLCVHATTTAKAPLGAAVFLVDRQADPPAASDRDAAAESRLDAAERTVTEKLERHAPELPATAAATPVARAVSPVHTTERSNRCDTAAESG